MYAVVSSGGKQYRVEPGSTLLVERVPAEPGAPITFERVLLFGDGEQVTVGTPTVDGVTVRGTVLGAERGPKLIVFKYRPKARYRRRVGHRQHLTRVRIDAIDTPGETRRRDRKRGREEEPATADVAEVPEAGQEQVATGATAESAGAPASAKAGAPRRKAAARAAPEASAAAEASTAPEDSPEPEQAKPRRRTRNASKTEE